MIPLATAAGVEPVELSTKAVYTRLREGILRGEFDPQVPISQVQLSRQLGVSRTPLREALRMLQREGLIESEPNRRVRVSVMSIADLEQLYAMRVVLETLGLRLSFRGFVEEDFRILDECMVGMERHSGGDVDAWEEVHHVFHEQFHKYAGDRIIQLLRQLSDYTMRYRRSYLAEPVAWVRAAAEHRAILEACRVGDLSQATSELARHLSRTALSLIASADPAHDPATVREALRQVTDTNEAVPVDGTPTRRRPMEF
jgi:DNA-binding GntR family transcriptional regulator